MNDSITNLRNAIECVRDNRWAFATIDNGNGNIVQFKLHAPNELYIEASAPYWGDVEAQKRALKRLGFTPRSNGSLITPDAEELSGEAIYVNWVNVADVRPFAEEILYIFKDVFGEELREFVIRHDGGDVVCSADEPTDADAPSALSPASSQPAPDPHKQECDALRDQLRKVMVWQEPSATVCIGNCTVVVESPARDEVYIRVLLPFEPSPESKEQLDKLHYCTYGNDEGRSEFRKLTTFSDANQLFNEIKFIFERVCNTVFCNWQLSADEGSSASDNAGAGYDIFIQHSAEQTLQQALQRVGNHTWRSAVILEPMAVAHISDTAIDVNLSVCKRSQRDAAATKLRQLGYTQPLFGNHIAKSVDLSRADVCREAAKELIHIFEDILGIDSRLLILNYVDKDETAANSASGFAISVEKIEEEEPDFDDEPDNKPDDKVAAKPAAPERHDATTKYRDLYKDDNKESSPGCAICMLIAIALFIYYMIVKS